MRETTSTTYELENLVPYTEYSIRVQAVNENGPGAFSKDVVIRTYSAQPTQSPHNVTLEAASSTVRIPGCQVRPNKYPTPKNVAY